MTACRRRELCLRAPRLLPISGLCLCRHPPQGGPLGNEERGARSQENVSQQLSPLALGWELWGRDRDGPSPSVAQQLSPTAAPSLPTARSSVHSDFPNIFPEQTWGLPVASFNLSFPPMALSVMGNEAGRGSVNTPTAFAAFQALCTYTKKPCYRGKLQFRSRKILPVVWTWRNGSWLGLHVPRIVPHQKRCLDYLLTWSLLGLQWTTNNSLGSGT